MARGPDLKPRKPRSTKPKTPSVINTALAGDELAPEDFIPKHDREKRKRATKEEMEQRRLAREALMSAPVKTKEELLKEAHKRAAVEAKTLPKPKKGKPRKDLPGDEITKISPRELDRLDAEAKRKSFEELVKVRGDLRRPSVYFLIRDQRLELEINTFDMSIHVLDLDTGKHIGVSFMGGCGNKAPANYANLKEIIRHIESRSSCKT